MIKLIGLKRLIILCALLGVNLALAAGYFLVLSPMIDEATQRQASLSAETSELNRKIATTKQETAFLRENIDSYYMLQERGFFKEQDRFMIGRLIDETGRKAGLTQFTYSVSELNKIDSPEAKEINHQLVNSVITVSGINTALDNGIYTLMQDIGNAFPEHTRIRKFEIKRARLLDDKALQDIASGNVSSGLITGEVAFDWTSLVPIEEPAAAAAGVPVPSTAPVPAPARASRPPASSMEGL